MWVHGKLLLLSVASFFAFLCYWQPAGGLGDDRCTCARLLPAVPGQARAIGSLVTCMLVAWRLCGYVVLQTGCLHAS